MKRKLMFQILAVVGLITFLSCNCNAQDDYKTLSDSKEWSLQLSDPCTGNWQDNWFLDGLIATVETSEDGMNFTAGPEFRNDAHHAVLWTEESFKGDVKMEYYYTRTDSQTINVNILYIQAQGIGTGPYDKDISKWNKLREVPKMSLYYDYMNPLHISYAAFPMVNEDPDNDYLRVRKYPVNEEITFDDMEVEPAYFDIGLFLPDVTYKVSVLKTDELMYMNVEGGGEEKLYSWDLSKKAKLEDGRIGLRHMYTRSARYKDFKVWTK